MLGGLTMTANGQIFTPHDSQLIDQLNAGDTITGVNGVPFEHLPSGGIFASSNLFRADRYKPWLAKVEAAGNALPPHARAMEVLTSMPYFMPNHLVTVSVPPMHLAHLGIDANDAKPPLIAQPTPTALGLGFAPGDVLVTVVADGMRRRDDVHRRRAAPAHRQRERPAIDHRAADDARRIALPPTRGRTRTGKCGDLRPEGRASSAERWVVEAAVCARCRCMMNNTTILPIH